MGLRAENGGSPFSGWWLHLGRVSRSYHIRGWHVICELMRRHGVTLCSIWGGNPIHGIIKLPLWCSEGTRQKNPKVYTWYPDFYPHVLSMSFTSAALGIVVKFMQLHQVCIFISWKWNDCLTISGPPLIQNVKRINYFIKQCHPQAKLSWNIAECSQNIPDQRPFAYNSDAATWNTQSLYCFSKTNCSH